MTRGVTEILQELVAIPSVNPMGRALGFSEANDPCNEIYLELRVTSRLQTWFEELKLPFQRQQVAPLRENIIARLDATENARQAPVLLWEVHQDTVPVDGMTIDPFRPPATSERIYGRGSCDVKGSMAAMLVALTRLAREPRRECTIVFACTVNEEHGYTGVKELVKLWQPGAAANVIPRQPAAAVVAEPTELNVIVAHKGAIRWKATTHGRACHSSNPANGTNAIYLMQPLLAAVETYHAEISRTGLQHRFCGRPTASLGVITGGVSVNTVPDECSVEIDRRVTPGEDPVTARNEMIAFIEGFLRDRAPNDPHAAKLLDGGLTHGEPFLKGAPLTDENNGAWGRAVQTAAAQAGLAPQINGVPFGTDAAVISGAGVPAVVFGPGSIQQAHTCDEWIAISQLQQGAEAWFELGRLPAAAVSG